MSVTKEVQYWLTLFLLLCQVFVYFSFFHFVFLKTEKSEKFKIKTWRTKVEESKEKEDVNMYLKIWWCWIRIHDCFCDPVLDVNRVGESMENLFLEKVSFVRFFMHDMYRNENYHHIHKVWPVNKSFARSPHVILYWRKPPLGRSF